MTPEPVLLTPGPTPVPPEIREELAKPLIHHRTPEFQAILKEIGEGLKALFGTTQDVFLLTSSGTGAMEAAVANLLSAGDEALVIRGGKFGERWGEICQAYGVQVIPIDSPWGKPLDCKEVARKLSERPKIKAVFSTHCETSTAVTYDIQGLRKAMGRSEALLVVDTISALLSEPFAMDAWGVDVAVSGSQKGFMLPPGLAFIAFSPRAWDVAAHSTSPRYYFDLNLAKKAWGQTDTPFTPAISLIIGLARALKRIQSVGLDRILSTHRAHAEEIRQAVKRLGLELYADPACASNAVTAVKVPPGINGKEILKKLKEHRVILAGGQAELAGKIFRIASMGAIGEAEIRIGMEALEKVLGDMGWKPNQGDSEK